VCEQIHTRTHQQRKKRNRGNTESGETKKHTIHGERTARLDGFGGDDILSFLDLVQSVLLCELLSFA